MICIDGYYIAQEPLRNKITIRMPQTWDTLQGTNEIPRKRRKELTGEELSLLLLLVKEWFEKDGEENGC